MRKSFVFATGALLLSACMAFAQAANGQGGGNEPGGQGGPGGGAGMAGPRTVTGCLFTPTEGNYMLATEQGMMARLMGSADQLKAAVGHTVTVTGTPGGRGSAGGPGGGQGGGGNAGAPAGQGGGGAAGGPGGGQGGGARQGGRGRGMMLNVTEVKDSGQTCTPPAAPAGGGAPA